MRRWATILIYSVTMSDNTTQVKVEHRVCLTHHQDATRAGVPAARRKPVPARMSEAGTITRVLVDDFWFETVLDEGLGGRLSHRVAARGTRGRRDSDLSGGRDLAESAHADAANGAATSKAPAPRRPRGASPLACCVGSVSTRRSGRGRTYSESSRARTVGSQGRRTHALGTSSCRRRYPGQASVGPSTLHRVQHGLDANGSPMPTMRVSPASTASCGSRDFLAASCTHGWPRH